MAIVLGGIAVGRQGCRHGDPQAERANWECDGPFSGEINP